VRLSSFARWVLSQAVVDFSREGVLVRFIHLPSFLAWNLRRTPGVFGKLRRLGAMALSVRLGTRGLDHHLAFLRENRQASWMRYSTDGGRMQIFDVERGRVTKVPLQPRPGLVAQEVATRQKMGACVPPLLHHDPERGILVETWMDLDPVPGGMETLAEAIRLLHAFLYTPVPMAIGDYLPKLAVPWDLSRALAFMDSRGLDQVLVSQVHGDLWPGNLGRDQRGNLQILDWEYTRPCVWSHDVWTYIMQERRSSGHPFDKEFLCSFARGLALLQRETCDMAIVECLHLIHLAERCSFFIDMNLIHKAEELCFLREQIAALLEP